MIENYTLSQWITFFYIYSFLGWCVESSIVSVTKRKPTNRGFLIGPMLPLYGFGRITILLATLWTRENILLVYLFGLIAATCLEYVTGVAMEAIFNMKYWDYSTKRFNLNGYICLQSSLFWGLLAVIIVCFLHEAVSNVVLSMNQQVLRWILIGIVTFTIIDIIMSFKKALDLKKLLAYETAVKHELTDLTARLLEAKDAFTERTTEKQKMFFARQEGRIANLKEEQEAIKKKMSGFGMSTLRSFPSATSKRFGDALSEFRDYFNLTKR